MGKRQVWGQGWKTTPERIERDEPFVYFQHVFLQGPTQCIKLLQREKSFRDKAGIVGASPPVRVISHIMHILHPFLSPFTQCSLPWMGTRLPHVASNDLKSLCSPLPLISQCSLPYKRTAPLLPVRTGSRPGAGLGRHSYRGYLDIRSESFVPH
jgi:hypothetical protein